MVHVAEIKMGTEWQMRQEREAVVRHRNTVQCLFPARY